MDALVMNPTIFFAFDRAGRRFQWAFWRQDGMWFLRDHEGYRRTLEQTWYNSVPRIRAILENYGLKAEVS